MKYLFTLLLLLVHLTWLFAQCECTDCPMLIEDLTTITSSMEISGAVNDELGVSGQELCMVCLNLTQDAMEELDIILTAPDGSSVALTVNDVIGFGTEIFFEICFVPCSQSADPDSGFSDVFDTGNDWQNNTTYDGTYYPQDGCLEDLTGDVNGQWELEITDVFVIMDGELFDWYLVFSDDSGIGCSNSSECGAEPVCLAEGGELNATPLIACEGASELNIDIDPSFPNNNEPPMPQFDYSWIIVNSDTDVIEDISSDSDLTSYPPGTYILCGLSFLVDDEPLIPSPDGSLTIDDIDDDIDDDDYCADLSDDCMEITIDPDVQEPDFDGPIEVCTDEINTYTILDYDPNIIYTINFTGDVSFFSGSGDTYEIAWTSGPAQICALIESICGDVETCIDVIVNGSPEDLEIIGEFDPCPGSIETYVFEPELESGESYSVTVSGGTIINQNDDSVEIEWPEMEGTQEICIELIGSNCPGSPLCEDIEVELDFLIPTELDSPEELCEGLVGISEINGSNDVLQYIWTVTNLDIIDGQNTETLEYIGSDLGLATVCLEIITNCGPQGPICEDIEILEIPEPTIEEIQPSCSLTFTLISDADPDNEITWTLENGPGNVDIEDPNQTTTEVTVTQPGIYQFQIDEVNESCSESEQISIEILADLDISDPIYECNLDNEYNVTFTILNGDSPYFINGIEFSGNVFISEFIESEEDYEFEIIDDIGCSAIIEDDFTCPCVSDAGNMNQDPILLCIQEETIFFGDWEADGVLDNNDIGIYYLHDGDDDELGQILDFNSTGEFEYTSNYEFGVEYFISYVVGNNDGTDNIDLDDSCLSVSQGQVVIFYDLPFISFEYQTKTCENTISISGEWDENEISINWSKISGPGTVLFSNSNSIPTVIEVSEQGSYVIEAELENFACINTLELDLEFAVPPQIINVNEQCNNAADSYTVSFEVLNGNGPYTASINGTFFGDIFTSELIPTGQPYNIFITDIDGCNSIIVTGNKLCDCISDSGFMDTNLITACVSQDSINVLPIIDNILDGDDIGLYFLHTNSVNTLGDIVTTSDTPTFYYNSSIVLDSIYYVSFVVANNNGGLIDFSDPCLDISNGQPIMWNSIPLVNAGEDQSTCDGILIINASPNNGEWQMISSPTNSALASFNSTSSNENIILDEVGIYQLIWQANNGNCISSDTLLLTMNSSPQIDNINTECSLDLLSYTLQFEIIDNSIDFLVNGMTSENLYEANNLDVTLSTNFNVTNNFGCTTIIDIGPIICNCESTVGTINDEEQNLCSFDLIDVNISNGDFLIEPGDTLAYVLHDGTSTELGSILAVSYGDDIPFGSNMMFNTPYYLNVVIGNNINAEIDLNDGCLQISQGVSVIFTEELNVSIDDNLEGCIGDQVSFNVTSNIYPIDITLINQNGDIISETIIDQETDVIIEIISLQEIWNIDDVNNQCINNISGDVNISGKAPTEFEFIEGFEICNNDFFGASVSITDIFTTDIPSGEWSLNGVILNNDELEFSDLIPGDYTVSYSNIGFDNPCPGMIDDITFTVIECNCAVFDNPNLEICSSEASILISNLDTQGLEGTWSIINSNNLINPPTIENDFISFDLESDGIFEILFSIDDANYPIDCDQTTSFQLTIYPFLDAGEQINIPIFCDDEDTDIILSNYLSSSDINGIWTFNNMVVPTGIINSNNLNFGENNFSYTLQGNPICAESIANLVVIVEERPQVQIISENVLCFGFDDGEIEIIVENPNGETTECFLNDIIQSEKEINNLEPGEYQVYVQRGNCTSDILNVTISEPDPISVELGDDMEIEINSEITIKAIVNILDSDIGDITWLDLSGILQIDTLELTSIFENDNTISIFITDENGCIAEDVINIRVNAPPLVINEIYIPNIFSPQANDSNNTFGMLNTDHVDNVNAFFIFDRWGNKVFSKENLKPDDVSLNWDGYFNNELAIQGVYVFMIKVSYKTGESEIFAGDITLIR